MIYIHICIYLCQVPRTVQGPTGLESPVPDELIQEIMEDISTDWKMVGRYLPLKEGVLRSIEEEKRRVIDMGFEMFSKWKQLKGPAANVKALVNALSKAGRNDLAGNVKGTWVCYRKSWLVWD